MLAPSLRVIKARRDQIAELARAWTSEPIFSKGQGTETEGLKRRTTMGRPFLSVLEKMAGAWPRSERPNKIRELP